MSTKILKAVIDRIEDDKAVLEVEGRHFAVLNEIEGSYALNSPCLKNAGTIQWGSAPLASRQRTAGLSPLKETASFP